MADDQEDPQPYDSVTGWLLEQGYQELGQGELIRGVGQRIVASGIPLHRISIGGMIMHPTFGALHLTWDAQTDMVQNDKFPRSGFLLPEFQNSPFFYTTANKIPFLRYHLEDESSLERTFPLFEKFRSQGVTDYILMFLQYGEQDKILWADLPEVTKGVVCSFSTRRIGGFQDHEIAYLRQLSLPLAFSIKEITSRELSKTILDTYLGAYSGSQVLDGQFERGDGTKIDCVLWFCDLRDSTALADKMPLDEFLGMVNDYFECVAGAVLDHGGEVLRFIGDAVFAIFPFDDETRPIANMSRAAVATAREAISRVDRHNENIKGSDRPEIRFGVSLHVGSVMYGNIGTERRLEFSVIGPAANEVVRLEGLCKKLQKPIVASESFGKIYAKELVPLGNQPADGVEGGLTAYTLPEYGDSDD